MNQIATSTNLIFRRHEYIPHNRDVLWQIISGTVRTMTWNEAGDQIILGIWGSHDVLGMSVLDPYKIQCLTDVFVTVLPRPKWYLVSINILTQHCQSEQLLNILHYRTIESRLWHFLLWLSEKFGKPCRSGVQIDVRLTHQDIADTIGSTRVSVTKLINQFRNTGLISYERHYITLHNLSLRTLS